VRGIRRDRSRNSRAKDPRRFSWGVPVQVAEGAGLVWDVLTALRIRKRGVESRRSSAAKEHQQ